jgi:penicillin-insensitive murein endopeptidase
MLGRLMLGRLVLVLACSMLPAAHAAAQTPGSLSPPPLPPVTDPDDPNLAAKELFGRALAPAPLVPAAIGGFARGCLAGAVALPFDGASWQVMRPSRNRNWGHPALIAFLERLAGKAPAVGWPGLLVGDMSQPRGGPMLTGHASHQIGLDADIWLTPMPNRELTRAEREELSATDVVREDLMDIRPDVWTERHFAVIRAAAMEPKVQRIFVNPAIKRALCRAAEGEAWMRKVRPMWGHNYHFHIRLFCPEGSSCRDQEPTPTGDGCDSSLAWWFTDEALHPKKSNKTWPPMTMSALPPACREVLNAR